MHAVITFGRCEQIAESCIHDKHWRSVEQKEAKERRKEEEEAARSELGKLLLSLVLLRRPLLPKSQFPNPTNSKACLGLDRN